MTWGDSQFTVFLRYSYNLEAILLKWDKWVYFHFRLAAFLSIFLPYLEFIKHFHSMERIFVLCILVQKCSVLKSHQQSIKILTHKEVSTKDSVPNIQLFFLNISTTFYNFKIFRVLLKIIPGIKIKNFY